MSWQKSQFHQPSGDFIRQVEPVQNSRLVLSKFRQVVGGNPSTLSLSEPESHVKHHYSESDRIGPTFLRKVVNFEAGT